MKDFRCEKCRQLQFKYQTVGEKMKIEVKCYNCNHFNNFTIWFSSLLRKIKRAKKHVKDNEHVS